MLSEIKEYFQFIKTDSGGKRQRETIIFIILFFLVSIPLNHFVLSEMVEDDLFIRFQQAKVLFLNNLSPYNEDVQGMIENMSNQSDWDPNPRVFDIEISPIGLIFYLPFSLIKNITFGTTLFLTTIEFVMISAIYLLIILLRSDEHGKSVLVDLLFVSTTLFFLRTLFSGNLAALSILLVAVFIYSLHNQKFVQAGIILGLMFFEIITIPAMILICVIGIVKNKQITTLIWSFISFSISSLLLMVFDRNWPIAWLKNLFLTPQRVPFLTFPQVLSMKYGFPSFQLFSVLALGLVIWLLFETWRNPFNTVKAWLWGLGLGGLINYYLFLQMDDTAAIALVISQILIVSIWREKITGDAIIIITVFQALITIVLSLIYFFVPGINKDLLFNLFLLIGSLLFCLNLYWLRRWSINIFDYEEKNISI